MKTVLFGTGSPLSVAALRCLAATSVPTAVVMPVRRGLVGWSVVRSLRLRKSRLPLLRLARLLKLPVLECETGSQQRLARELTAIRPDLLCVASFPFLLQGSVLEASRFGAVGVHLSLLPRHRGPSPLFWTYLCDDAQAGVTVYRLDAGEDTGDVLEQEAIPLARGRPVTDLYGELAGRGASLLGGAVEAIGAQRAAGRGQDAAEATREPSPFRHPPRIDWADWKAERLWHVLRGVGDSHGPLLRRQDGRPIPHGRAIAFREGPRERASGSIERLARGWRLFCADGIVDVEGPRLASRVRGLLRRARVRRRSKSVVPAE
jgi:methionyl-tRNA formyltransferase